MSSNGRFWKYLLCNSTAELHLCYIWWILYSIFCKMLGKENNIRSYRLFFFFFYFFFNLIYKQTLALLDYLISKKANMTFSQIVAVPTEEPMSSILSECPFTCLLNSQWETKQIRKAQAALCMQEPCTAKGPSLEAWSCMEQLHIQIHTFSSSFLLVNLNKTPLKKHSILSQLFEEAMESVFIYKGLVDDILVSLSDIIEIEKILFLFAF